MNQIQILGSGQEALSMIFDILSLHSHPSYVSIIPNTPFTENPTIPFQNPLVPYQIIQPESFPWEHTNLHCTLGAMGSLNQNSKKQIFQWFLSNHNIQTESYINLIHPNSTLSSTSSLQNGIHIEPGVILAPYTSIGFGVSINRNASVGHHTSIGDFCTINPGANIASSCHIGENSIIGSHSFVSNHITIGEQSIIGAGSIVLQNIPPRVLAYGNPCRVIRSLQ